MKNIKRILIIFLLIISYTNIAYSTNETIKGQMNTLNISSVIKEGQKYTKENFPDVDITELLNDAITGKIDNESLYKKILSLLGEEIKNTFSVLRWNISNNCYT